MATIDLTRTAQLPAFARPTAANLPQEMAKIQEVLNVREGNTPNGNLMDRGVTIKDLFDYGLISVTDATGKKRTGTGSSNDNPGTGGNVPIINYNVDIPPPPSNVQATGTLSSIFVSFDPPLFANFARAEIWRAPVNDFAKAARIGSTSLDFYVDTVGSGVTDYYWVRFVSTAGINGPFNAQAGVMGQTGEDPAYVLGLLQGKITGTQLANSLNTRINSVFRQATAPLAYTVGDLWYDTGHGNHEYWWDGNAWSDTQDQQTVTNTQNIATQGSAIQTEQTVRHIAIAPDYDATKTYALNTVVQYGNALYTCTTAITTPEAWNAAHWTLMTSNVYAQYTVKTDVNGYIAGFGLMNTGSTSEFIVRTDTFAVVPAGAAAGATTHAPFIVGSVNGQSTVGIDGALVVDGSISAYSIHASSIGADKLAVSTLSAITANVGTLTGGLVQSADGTVKYDLTNKLFSVNDGTYNRVLLGYTPSGYGLIINDAAGNLVLDSAGNNNLTAKNITGQGPFATLSQITPSNIQTYIANLAVNTLQLAGQAVTIPQSTYAGAQVTFSTSSTFTEIIKNGTGFVSSGAPINIIINAVMSVKGSLQVDVQLQRLNSDGSLNAVLWECDQVLGQPGTPGLGVTAPAGFCYVDTPGAGTWYYRLAGRENGGSSNTNSWYAKNRYMLLLETKK